MSLPVLNQNQTYFIDARGQMVMGDAVLLYAEKLNFVFQGKFQPGDRRKSREQKTRFIGNQSICGWCDYTVTSVFTSEQYIKNKSCLLAVSHKMIG